MIASAAAGRATLRGDRGDMVLILGGAAPACEPYSDRLFPDDVLECFRIVSLQSRMTFLRIVILL
jgi:hypothetical protein